jgi:hypothetical protein
MGEHSLSVIGLRSFMEMAASDNEDRSGRRSLWWLISLQEQFGINASTPDLPQEEITMPAFQRKVQADLC